MKTKEKRWNTSELAVMFHLAIDPIRHALDDAVKAMASNPARYDTPTAVSATKAKVPSR